MTLGEYAKTVLGSAFLAVCAWFAPGFVRDVIQLGFRQYEIRELRRKADAKMPTNWERKP